MVWKGPPAMLLLVLLATWLALAWGETRFGKFQRQHVADPRTGDKSDRDYCNQMMQSQGMTSPICKPKNTFIHVNNPKPVTEVCGRGGKPADGNLRNSNDPFVLTTCKLRGGSPRSSCKYDGERTTQRIRIACDRGGHPVHYDGPI